MKLFTTLIYELLLIFASTLIFWGLWTILDKVSFMKTDLGIFSSLAAGILITIFVLIKLNKLLGDKNK